MEIPTVSFPFLLGPGFHLTSMNDGGIGFILLPRLLPDATQDPV
jgi:hypothetical protein